MKLNRLALNAEHFTRIVFEDRSITKGNICSLRTILKLF